MPFTKDSPAYQQLLKLHKNQVELVSRFLREQGYPTNASNNGRGNISLTYMVPAEQGALHRGVYTAMIKVDLWVNKTGNILVEHTHARKQASGKVIKEYGWLHTGRADTLFVIDPLGNKLYQFNWKLLKAYTVGGGEGVALRQWTNKIDENTISSAYFVKLSILKEKGLLVNEWDI